MTHDYKAALDALNKWNCIDRRLNHKAREFGRDQAELFLECNLQAIRAALTAQDVNAELLEALKIIASGGVGQFQWSLTKAENLASEAIARAEQKGVSNDIAAHQMTNKEPNNKLVDAVKIVREGYDWQASECPEEYRDALNLILIYAERKGGV